jgi:hypothetical protein
LIVVSIEAGFTVSTRLDVVDNHSVTLLDVCDSFPGFCDDSGTFVAKGERNVTWLGLSGQVVEVASTETSGLEINENVSRSDIRTIYLFQ